MSLVGCPTVEFLDEPTTGVDPVSRRSLFKMLKGLPNSSLILTTHRMDEAESLCDNIAIMINGRFVCYGSPGHLKSNYGQGYSISVDYSPKENGIGALLPQYMEIKDSAEVQNDQAVQVMRSTIKVKMPGPQLNEMFKDLQKLKESEQIKDFTVTRSSLETVFVEFAKHQIEQINLQDINLQ